MWLYWELAHVPPFRSIAPKGCLKTGAGARRVACGGDGTLLMGDVLFIVHRRRGEKMAED
jgi:hypothetical protein